ncbi:MAG: hypothetical protein V3S43_00015 [Acidimicrobiia bacterium]
MAKIIQSQALDTVNESLGLAGSGDAQSELLDGVVHQFLDVGPIARRGRTFAANEGIFKLQLANIHVITGVLDSTLNPYALGAAAINPFPEIVPRGFDLWLLGASLIRTSGSSILNDAALFMSNLASGGGIDSNSVATALSPPMCVAMWTDLSVLLTTHYAQAGDGSRVNPFKNLQIRIPRIGGGGTPVSLTFESKTNGTATMVCTMLVGMFPTALGQDAIGSG